MPLPEAPLPPEDGMCCGNGCDQCVWTLYQTELDAYRRALQSCSGQLPAEDAPAGKTAHG